MQIPDQNKKFLQTNDGESRGNVQFTYGIDIVSNKGKIKVAEKSLNSINSDDTTAFDGYAGAIFPYSGAGGKILAISDRAFIADPDDIPAGFAQDTDGSDPTPGNTVTNGCEFNGLALVSDGTDIKSYNGSTWTSWWGTTLGQTSLSSSGRRFMRVGANGNLYLTDNGNKVYRVRYTGSYSISKTGNGTLDFSATPYTFTAMEPTSNRMWIGTQNTNGKAIIIEWDMSANSSTANRWHEVGADAVRCIYIFNDTPYAVLSTGKIVGFNGVSFSELEGLQFPVAENQFLYTDFIHPNGWDIIDGLPHLLVSGRVYNSDSAYMGTAQSYWTMASGVYCVDPQQGVHLRYPLKAMSIPEVGALLALDNLDTKFLSSYSYYKADKTILSVLEYHDRTNSQASTAFLATSFDENYQEGLKSATILLNPLASGEKINVYYRDNNQDSLSLEGVWFTSTQMNLTGVNLGVSVGDVAFVKIGPDAGVLLRITAVNESNTITEIIFDRSASTATLGDYGVIEVLNFRYIGTLESTTLDEKTFSFSQTKKAKKAQVLLELQQNAAHKLQVDYCIIK